MSVPSNVSEFPVEPQEVTPPLFKAVRPLYWSIRRELWENRSVYLAPLIVAGVALFGFLVSSPRFVRNVRGLETLDAARQRIVAVTPYSLVASMILFSSFLVGLFYCLDALSGERRDRSLLFWKSLPVSDITSVLSKVLVPVAVLPLLAMTIALATQAVMLVVSSLILVANGINPWVVWSRLPLFQITIVMVYGVTAHAVWFSPLYGWILLVSAWARRATFIWVVLPIFAAFAIEHMAFGTKNVLSLLKYRFNGAMTDAFAVNAGHTPITRLSQLDPVKFLTSPGLWSGLAFAAACLAAAVRLRRNREPV